MEEIGKRIKIIDSQYRIATPKNYFMLIFLPIWLAAWTAAGLFAIRALLSGKASDALYFIIAWLCGWLAAELFVLLAFLWGAFGYEIISIYQGKLKIKRSIFGYGPGKEFDVSRISNLRASGFFGPMTSWKFGMAFWGLWGGTVAFEYNGKTRRFGISLSEDDANKLVSSLKERLSI